MIFKFEQKRKMKLENELKIIFTEIKKFETKKIIKNY